MSRDKRDAERAARRAERLAERAEERARRKERHAERAAERAERLAKEGSTRQRNHEDSIEDMVDRITERAEQWAERFIDEQTSRWADGDAQREIRRAEREAERARDEAQRARANAERASRAASDLGGFRDSLADEYEDDIPRRRYGTGRSRRSRRRRRRSAHCYRDRQNGKVLGVCAGIADYFGRSHWEIRTYAILGMIFFPSVTIPAYFITYFVMDDKPYYRRVTDRFEEELDSIPDDYDDGRAKGRNDTMATSRQKPAQSQMDNVQAMKVAKDKFANIEQRLRDMESHVTSSQFELRREFRRIAGED